MTYAETYQKLQKAKADGVTEIRVEINEGEFTFPIDEAIEGFEGLAPGEPFEIVEEPVEIKHGDRVSVEFPSRIYGMQPHNFTVGSVAGYSAESGLDVAEHIERANRLGHDLYYVFAEGVTITAHRQEPVERIRLTFGQIVKFDGHLFEITEARNQNIRLLPA